MEDREKPVRSEALIVDGGGASVWNFDTVRRAERSLARGSYRLELGTQVDDVETAPIDVCEVVFGFGGERGIEGGDELLGPDVPGSVVGVRAVQGQGLVFAGVRPAAGGALRLAGHRALIR